jgi:DNA polymerase-3 subunit beta
MKFISTQQNLTQGLSIAEKIIGRNFSLPILQDVLITSDKNKNLIKISSTDLEMGLEIIIPAKITEEGQAAAPAKLLSEFIRNLPNENVEFSEKNKKISIICKNYKANIKGDDPKQFPLIPIKQNTKSVAEIKKDDFLKGISSVINSVSILDIKPEISGVFVCFRKKSICFVATDSFRLSEKTVNIDGAQEMNVIIPKKTSDTIIKIFNDTNDTISIEVSNNQIIVKDTKVTFVSRVIDGEYPNYEQIIPNKFATQIKLSKTDLMQHIKTASLFSNKIKEVVFQINPEKQSIEILSTDEQFGDHHSTLACEAQGAEQRLVFNYQYLLEGMQNIISDNIQIKLNEPTTPVLIIGEENDGFRYVVMPIKN